MRRRFRLPADSSKHGSRRRSVTECSRSPRRLRERRLTRRWPDCEDNKTTRSLGNCRNGFKQYEGARMTDHSPSLRLLVLKSVKTEAMLAFYTVIGLRFEQEQHRRERTVSRSRLAASSHGKNG